MFVVDPVGRSGGLALLWKNGGEIQIQNYTRRHVNAIVKPHGQEISWRLTGFYGHPNVAKRNESWTLLNHLRLFSPEAWVCIGDFNKIVDQAEKSGAVERRDSQMEPFQSVLEDCDLSDLGFTGSKYTWTNRRHDGSFTKERLDRAVANKAWCEMNGRREVKVLAGRSSDHKPLLLCIEYLGETMARSHKSFKI